MTDEQIAKLIRRRERLTNRRDERVNRPAVAEIDAQLATLEPGQRNDVDLLLGRPNAQLTVYAAIARALDAEEERRKADAEIIVRAVEDEIAERREAGIDAEMRKRCADYEIEPPTHDGMWK